MSQEQLLGALSEAHDDLLIASDMAVTRGNVREGEWGVREILAHVAAWEAEATRRIPLLAQGTADQEYDVDSFNAAAMAAIGDQSLGEVRAGLEEVHARLVTLLDGLEEAAFAAGSAPHEWVTALTRHSREHVRELNSGGPHRGLT
jgi:hypothetical protein